MIDKYKLEHMKDIIDNVVQDIREDSQIDVLSILTQTLTKKGNVRVIFGSKTPYSNIKSNQIFLPRQIFPSDSFVDWILKKGISLHEAFHILFTGNAKRIVNKLRPSSYNIDWNLLKMCLNSIEDVRIEFLGMNLYRGCPELLGFSLSFFHKLALMEKNRMITDVLYSLSLELRGFKTLYPERKLMEKLIKISKDVIYQDFEGCVKIALDIYDVLIKDLPSQETSKMNSTRNNKSDNGVGKTQDQEFDFSGKKDKSKLSKEETKKIEKEFDKFKKEFEEMLDSDDSDSDESEEEEYKDEESEQSEEEREEDGKSEEESEDDDKDEDDQSSPEIMKSQDKIDKFVKIIKEKFKDEYTSQEKIERQIRMKAGDETEKLEKEFMDSDGAGLSLNIPRKGYESKFNTSRADSTADMISQELKNRIIIGRTLVGDQTTGKLKLKSAVRSFVKYNIDGEFDNHIYEKELIETPEHSVILMIDCSGSMGQMDSVYDKITGNLISNKVKLSNSKETTYILGKVFETLGVKFAIRGFEGYNDFLVKKWDDELDVRRINGLTAGGGTPTAQATVIATKKLEEVEDELKIIFTITDGMADESILTQEKVKLTREKGIHIFGIFFGQDNANYRMYFENIYGKDNFIIAKDGEELKDGIVKLYEKILKKVSYGFNGGE
jgi:hypothetical protein